jgi:hypothetical protein
MGEQRRIGVLTFHRCINYGSYWQARCLTEGLRARGFDAVLLDHHSRRVTAAELRCAFQPQLPRRTAPGDLAAFGRKTRAFVTAIDALPLSRAFPLDDPATMDPVDTVVVGSDEVWNFAHPWYAGERVFFGDGLRTDRLISYAASFGNHDAEGGMGADWAARLRRFDAIAVRDANAERLVTEAVGAVPTLVLDPCLQFPDVIAAEAPKSSGDYAVVYGHNFPDWFERRIRGWADRTGTRLVSIGYRTDWADEQLLDAGPLDFARVMAGARAVATNFFHGCVFALVSGTPFVCASTPYRRNKLRDLTAKLDASAHLLDEGSPDEAYDTLLGQPLAPAIQQRIDALRAQSSAYLDRALG